jgi:hypothetical protein
MREMHERGQRTPVVAAGGRAVEAPREVPPDLGQLRRVVQRVKRQVLAGVCRETERGMRQTDRDRERERGMRQRERQRDRGWTLVDGVGSVAGRVRKHRVHQPLVPPRAPAQLHPCTHRETDRERDDDEERWMMRERERGRE